MNLMNRVVIHLKRYSAAYIVGILFFYCFSQMPLHFDQLVSVGMYTEYGGLLNYITGYCWFWVTQVNGRLMSTLIGGFLEQNYTLMFLVDSVLLAFFPVLCMRAFAKREQVDSKLLWISALALLLLSRQIELEVLSYALFIYFVPVMLVLYLICSMESFIPSKEICVTRKDGSKYLCLVLVLSLWLENITFGMLIVSGSLFLWDWFVNRRKNGYLLAGTILAFLCLLWMTRFRANATTFKLGFEEQLKQIMVKINIVLDAVFLDNAILTAGMALIAMLAVLHVAKGRGKQGHRYIYAAFCMYIFATHLVSAYNSMIQLAQAIPVPLAGTGSATTSLPMVTWSILLPPENDAIRLLIYLFFAVSLLYPILLSERRLLLLTSYGFAMSSMGVVFFTTEYWGSRIIAPSLLLLLVTMIGICADFLPELNARPKVIKWGGIILIAIFLLRCDYYVQRYTAIGQIREYNDTVIEYAVERQIKNEWDYDTDVLALKYYWGNTELFCANIVAGDPHFQFFCQYYDLNPATQIAYTH